MRAAEEGKFEEYSTDSDKEISAPKGSPNAVDPNSIPMTSKEFEIYRANIQYDTESSGTRSNVDWKEEVVEKPIDVGIMAHLMKLSK